MSKARIKGLINNLLDYALETTDAQAVLQYLKKCGYDDSELEAMGLM